MKYDYERIESKLMKLIASGFTNVSQQSDYNIIFCDDTGEFCRVFWNSLGEDSGDISRYIINEFTKGDTRTLRDINKVLEFVRLKIQGNKQEKNEIRENSVTIDRDKPAEDIKKEHEEYVQEKKEEDLVNHPPHYTYGGIETIDYMKAKATPEEFYGHLRLTALKYLSRAGHKDDTLQDYKKAQWYLNRLIKEMEGKE